MRLLVCGGRSYGFHDPIDFPFTQEEIDYLNAKERANAFTALDRAHAKRPVTVLMHGDCPAGADQLGAEWARERGIPIESYAVDHAKDGPWPGAGPRRNVRMLRDGRPDGVLALPGGAGTASMIRLAYAAHVPVWRPHG